MAAFVTFLNNWFFALVVAVVLLALGAQWLRHGTEGLSVRPDLLVAGLTQSEFLGRWRPNTRIVTLHYTNWCGACKIMKPVFDAVARDLAGSGIEFQRVDEDKAKTAGILQYPTILRRADGRLSAYPGTADYAQLRSWVLSPL